MRGKVMLMSLMLAHAAMAEEAPPDGFLEYLGTMVESEGELLDPLAMASVLEAVLAEPEGTADSEDGGFLPRDPAAATGNRGEVDP